MLEVIIRRLKAFIPFIGLSALFYFFILIGLLALHYYAPDSLALAQKLNPFYLLLRQDAIHYLNIALHGYSFVPMIFFPLYPFLIYVVAMFFTPVFSGFFVSFLSLSFALYYFDALLKETGNAHIRSRAIVLLLTAPTALFFASVYTESLFLALLLSFFFYLKKERWLIAALIACAATLTRNVGIFLLPVYLVAVYLSVYKEPALTILGRLKKLFFKKELWYSLFILAGLLGFCLYAYFKTGDALAFIHGQKIFSQWRSFMFPSDMVYNFYKLIFVQPLSQTGTYNFIGLVIIGGGSFLTLLVTTVYWFIKKDWLYATLCFFNLALFSCTFPMTSVNRYILVLFPIFIFLAKVTSKKDWLFYSLMALFVMMFVFNLSLFSDNSWVG